MLFAEQCDLEGFLRGLNPSYAGYAVQLWSNGVNSSDILANASVERLMARGITNDLHAEDIKARAGAAGGEARAAGADIKTPADQIAELVRNVVRSSTHSIHHLFEQCGKAKVH